MKEAQRFNSKERCRSWYGWIKDDNVRMESSSGGAFTAMADIVLAKDGVVIGAYFDPDIKIIKHASSDTVPIERMRKSKYVESDMSDAPKLINSALANGRTVLFCGTPCQCSAIRKCFGNTKDLILCDFFCHGVPSSRVFKDFLEFKEHKKKSRIIDYQFRTKDFGWSQHGIRTEYENGRLEKTVGRCEFYFTATMLDNLFLRKCCYTCDKAMYHDSDFTIGDFWGINKLGSIGCDDKGISILISNTPYGDELIPQLSESMELHAMEKQYIDYAFKVKTVDRQLENRDKKFNEYNKNGIVAFTKKHYRKRLFLSRLVFLLKKNKLKAKE